MTEWHRPCIAHGLTCGTEAQDTLCSWEVCRVDMAQDGIAKYEENKGGLVRID